VRAIGPGGAGCRPHRRSGCSSRRRSGQPSGLRWRFRGIQTDRAARSSSSRGVPPAWGLEAEAVLVVVVEAVGGVDKMSGFERRKRNHRSGDMKSTSASKYLPRLHWIIGRCSLWRIFSTPVLFAAQQSRGDKTSAAIASAAAGPKKFDTPQQAADALVDAAQRIRRGCSRADFWP